jgi:hypothetical protein
MSALLVTLIYPKDTLLRLWPSEHPMTPQGVPMPWQKKKSTSPNPTCLPPLEEFMPYLEQIWANKILTNAGPFHQQLEKALCEYLGVPHVALFSNGTLALITALQALRVTGEVITTPYSFVATAHALLWQNCKPVFVDVEPHTLNLDPAKIEAAITPQTTAILPVHCYGNPCDTATIQAIADNYNLRRGARLWCPRRWWQCAASWGFVGAQLSCHQGLQHL